jgi:hypothetical protein
VLVLDASPEARDTCRAFLADHADLAPTCVALSKSDLAGGEDAREEWVPPEWRSRAVAVSGTQRRGLTALIDTLMAALGRDEAVLAQPLALTDGLAEAFRSAAGAADHNDMFTNVLRLLASPGGGPSAGLPHEATEG